jgi:FHA domain-containing protein
VRVCFGECVLDTDLRRLTRGGAAVPLAPKAFRLLEVLAERAPRAVPKSELRELLWPDTAIGGTTLARLVNEVRAAIGDDARMPHFIRTVQRFGYAFSTPAPGPASGATVYRLVLPDREVTLLPGENLLGRVADGLVWIESRSASRRHARILVEGDAVVLEDLASKNGTFLHGRRISGPTPLADGDVFQLGRVSVRLRVVPPGEATETEQD